MYHCVISCDTLWWRSVIGGKCSRHICQEIIGQKAYDVYMMVNLGKRSASSFSLKTQNINKTTLFYAPVSIQ